MGNTPQKQLPTELNVQILKNLSKEDVLRAAPTNETFRDTVRFLENDLRDWEGLLRKAIDSGDHRYLYNTFYKQSKKIQQFMLDYAHKHNPKSLRTLLYDVDNLHEVRAVVEDDLKAHIDRILELREQARAARSHRELIDLPEIRKLRWHFMRYAIRSNDLREVRKIGYLFGAADIGKGTWIDFLEYAEHFGANEEIKQYFKKLVQWLGGARA